MEMDDTSVTICRLCAEMTSSKSFISLYTEDKKEQTITKQMNQLVNNLISPDDGLPQEVCLNCADNVAKFYFFVCNIIETQNKLRRIMLLPEIKKMDGMDNDNDVNNFFKNDHVSEDDNENISFINTDNSQVNEESNWSDNFVELLVVDESDMVGMNIGIQDILKTSNDVNRPSQQIDQRVVVSDDGNSLLCIKAEDLKNAEEDDVAGEDQDELMQETDDPKIETEDALIFLEDYEVDETVIKLPEQMKLYSADEVEYPDDAKILYKCSNCDHTFESEKSFQMHYCVTGDDIQLNSTARKNKDYYCNICNRHFKSELVFRLHASQHKRSTTCLTCNACFLNSEALIKHINETHPYSGTDVVDVEETDLVADERQCDVCGKITDNLKQHKMYHTIKELEYCKEENKKYLKRWFHCEKCNKKIFSEANFLFHLANHEGSNTVPCRQCDFIATNIQEYNMHTTTHTGGKYFICNDCDKCFFTRSAITDHVLVHMEGTRYMCEICGKRFKTSRSNAQHKLLQHKKYFRCNRCNRGFTHEAKHNSHINICQVIDQKQNDSMMFEPVERFFCNICNSNIKSSSEISILFHKAKHEGKEGVECSFCHTLCKNACMYKNHLLIHTNQRPYLCTQCPKSFRTKGCLVQHMLVHGDEYKYTCQFCGKLSKKLTTHVNHVNIHTGTKPYECPDCNRPFRQLSDMKKHRRTHLKYKTESITVTELVTDLPYMAIKTEVEDMMPQQL